MKKGPTIIGRVPRELSRIFWNFLTSGGEIVSVVTGRRKRGRGLEVPCTYKLHGSKKQLQELDACSIKRSNINLIH